MKFSYQGVCPYLTQRTLTHTGFQLFELSDQDFDHLLAQGYRRNTFFYYQNSCATCNACIPLRICLADFHFSRSQQKLLAKNYDIELLRQVGGFYKQEYFELFSTYQKKRYPANPPLTEKTFYTTMVQGPSFQNIFEYWLEQELVGLSWVDVTQQSLNAVYCAYNPFMEKRRLGIFTILAELLWAKQHNIAYYYLGFWIAGAKNMDYKKQFLPHEQRKNGVWQKISG